MARVMITYEFDSHSDSDEIKTLVYAYEFRSLLYELDQDIQSKLKYGQDDWLSEDAINYLETLRCKIAEYDTL